MRRRLDLVVCAAACLAAAPVCLAAAAAVPGRVAAAGAPTDAEPPPAGAARAAAPGLAARGAVLVETDLGVTILARDARRELPIASTTKLMTAYVALHAGPLGRVLTVAPYAAASGESLAGLAPGERLTVGDLLVAMILPSGGDAAHALAVGLAGSTDRFVEAMNAAAGRLHLGDTHFSTEVGLDTPGNHSSAGDLARLAGVLLRDPFFARTVGRSRAVLADGRIMVNTNDLVGRYGFVVGVKTGYTPGAGYCLVGAGRRRGATVISVVLGEPSAGARDSDTLGLLRYGLGLYRRVAAVRAGHVYARIPVDGRPHERLALIARRTVRLVLRAGVRFEAHPTRLAASARGPLPRNTVLGQLTVKLRGHVVARVPLVSRSPLAPPPVTPSR